MRKTYSKYFDETYYTEKMANGMEVVIFHRKDLVTTFAAFGTAYGALDIAQKHKGKEYHFHPGVAHFLEHKLFESEDRNIFDRFSEMGCNVNAFTSYKETVYYFSTTSKDIREPLKLLLDFVQDLRISDESVEKEKGIIIQEVSSYLQEADSRLLDETYKSLYHHFPLRFDIGGDVRSINAITKEELELAYAINYHPSRMVLVLVSPIDPQEIMETVREDQDGKDFTKQESTENALEEEPLEVARKEYSFEMDINKAKHVYALKLHHDFKDNFDCSYREWAMAIYLKAFFSPANPQYQKWLDKGIINDYFGFEVDFDLDYANIIFYNESESDSLKELVDGELKKDLLDEEILRQLKRRYIGASFRSLNDVSTFGSGYIRDHLGGFDFFDNIRILEALTVEDLKRVYAGFDYGNYTLTHVIPHGK